VSADDLADAAGVDRPTLEKATVKRVAPHVLAVAVVLTLATVVNAPARSVGAPGAGADPRPNILLVMTDDQTYQSIASMPNVQALAGRGTTFTDYHANFPLCCPSRVTTMTGQYVHNHGVWSNSGAAGGYPGFLPQASNSLPVWLHAAGYTTMAVGKYLNGYDATFGVPPGWDRWRVWDKMTGDETSIYRDVRIVSENGTVGTVPGYSTDTYRALARDLIDESSGGRPWFMWLGFNAPHTTTHSDPGDPALIQTSSPDAVDRDSFKGATAPRFGNAVFNEADVSDKPPHGARFPRMSTAMVRAVNESYSQQLETLQSVDRAIGDLEEKLAATGQLENTVIVFTTDNGFFYGEHRIPSGKRSPYPASSHLPLIVAGPGFADGAVDKSPRSNVDLAPTFVGLADADPGLPMDGVSLRAPVGASRPLLIEGRIPPWRVPQFTAIRRPHWFYARYAYPDGTVGVELYDLVADRDMLRNLHRNPAYKEREKALRSAMEAMAGYVVSRRSANRD
jgi:N-acetylglucosamine-6-sulfatase